MGKSSATQGKPTNMSTVKAIASTKGGAMGPGGSKAGNK